MKNANVAARVEPHIKEQAEAIMDRLGIPASTAINMFYHQVILWNGMPFRPSITDCRPPDYDKMEKDEFDARMAVGLAQAKAGQSKPMDKVFDELLVELGASTNV